MDEGGGGEKKAAEYPIGFRFKPKDEELVRYYLLPRLQGRPTVPNDSIIEANVYESHPETLTNEHKSGDEQEEWYFLSARSRMYGNGVRPARKTRDGRGRWKASTATKEVAEQVVCNGGVTFCRNVLNYFVGKPKNETRTKWIMLEITVPQYEIKLDNPAGPKNMLDEYVMCKIYVSPQHKKKADDDDDEQDPPAEHNLLEKQSGKRPMLVPQRGLGPPARKQARVGSLGIGSTPTQAMGCSTSNSACPPSQVYFGLPGQPTGPHYGLQAPPQMQQRPAGAYSGQAPARPPAGAFSGQRLVQMPAPTPVTYQPFANPIDEASPFGQTMARPPNPANQAAGRMLQCFPGNPPRRHSGTAFRPQVSLQCYYDQQNYRGGQGQPLGNASSSRLQSQATILPQQQPLFNRRGGAAAAAAPPGPPHNGYPFQRSSMPAAAGDHGGAANGAARFNVNAEQHFVELATMKPPSLDGWCMPPPPPAGHLVEPPAPAAAGAPKAEPETGETSGLNTQDAA